MLKLVKVDRKRLPDDRLDLIFLSECFHITLERKYDRGWARLMYRERYGKEVNEGEAQLALDDQFVTGRQPSYTTWGWFNMYAPDSRKSNP